MTEILVDIAWESWAVLGEMAPYLLFGFLMAGMLSVCISPEFIERHLGGRGFGPVLKAALLGVPLPLCSCGVIPVAASFRRHGASRAATTSFLLSTPQTGVDSIAVTYALLGAAFAVYRPIVALATGLLGGLLVMLFARSNRNGDAAEDKPPECHESCCSEEGTKTQRGVAGVGVRLRHAAARHRPAAVGRRGDRRGDYRVDLARPVEAVSRRRRPLDRADDGPGHSDLRLRLGLGADRGRTDPRRARRRARRWRF